MAQVAGEPGPIGRGRVSWGGRGWPRLLGVTGDDLASGHVPVWESSKYKRANRWLCLSIPHGNILLISIK